MNSRTTMMPPARERSAWRGGDLAKVGTWMLALDDGHRADLEAGLHATRTQPDLHAVFLNDAGIGVDGTGIVRLADLDSRNIPAGAVQRAPGFSGGEMSSGQMKTPIPALTHDRDRHARGRVHRSSCG